MQHQDHRETLRHLAYRAMEERGLLTDFPADVLAEADALPAVPPSGNERPQDLTGLLWCSIDNEDSRDLDQLTAAQEKNGYTRIYVAIADVDTRAPRQSRIDSHAGHNTLTVYTPARVFSMIPERLSTDLTSLNQDETRPALVITLDVTPQGIKDSCVAWGLVLNRARLDYDSVSAWLENKAPEPSDISRIKGLAENLRLQARAAGILRQARFSAGALRFSQPQARMSFQEGLLASVTAREENPAKEMIEEFMIASNTACARFLENKGFPSIRRVVRTPDRWDRIAALAHDNGGSLPGTPDAAALSGFLEKARLSMTAHQFQDLSTSIIKLLGPGQYTLETPGRDSGGHFGLAVRDYAHVTAPNRRYPDLLTHRLLKAAAMGLAVPYSFEELDNYAGRCTLKESDARKVERQLNKSAAALLLSGMTGREFDAIVTGAAAKGTWVRITQPFAEGRLEKGQDGLEVGDRLRVRLTGTDVERGFIDFEQAG